MRTRLIILLLIPISLVVLGVAVFFARSISTSEMQRVFVDRLSDATQFAGQGRAALTSAESEVVQAELVRYSQVYGISAAIVDRSNEIWLSSDPTSAVVELAEQSKVADALAGRRSQTPGFRWPGGGSTLTVAEPIVINGDVAGAVVIVSDLAVVDTRIIGWWALVALGSALCIAIGLFGAITLARWVLRPAADLSRALAAMGHGELQARVEPSMGPPELRRLAGTFNLMAGRLEEAMERQKAFVANASHELRNPLSALLLRLESLAMDLPPAQEESVEEVREEGRRMVRLLDALLQLARGENGMNEMRTVDLTHLVSQRVAAWRPLASRRGVQIHALVGLQVSVRADEIGIESALDALLDNAVKFSPEGSPISVRLGISGSDALVSVRDHGPGLSPDERSVAVDRFWRSPKHQNESGSGLGLAIAKTFLRENHGDVELDAAADGGLIVRIRLPLHPEVK
ncbi:sensor histidine kinase [Nakamurella silvestris]|nr:sensor histidine kinase [Nakamurella silvestris]